MLKEYIVIRRFKNMYPLKGENKVRKITKKTRKHVKRKDFFETREWEIETRLGFPRTMDWLIASAEVSPYPLDAKLPSAVSVFALQRRPVALVHSAPFE